MPFFEFSCLTEGCLESVSEFRPKWTPEKPECPQHGPMERDWHSEARVHIPGSAWPMYTKHLSGKMEEIRDPAHLKQRLKETGKVQRDDAAFIDEGNFYHVEPGRFDRASGKLIPPRVVYENGSGRGNKGSWY